MPAERLLVIRHGETDWNVEGRFQGHTDVSLNAAGERQIRQMALDVAPLSPAVIVSSDLIRARCTAEALVATTGAELVLDPALREIYLGTWEGLSREEAQARFPEEFAAWVGGEPVRRGGGETEEEAGERGAEAIAGYIRRLPSGVLAIVAHGMVLRAAMRALEARGLITLGGPAVRLGNAAWLAFDLQA